MACINLKTTIQAPLERVFDLARSIDAHLASAHLSQEIVVEGRSSGLIEEGDVITWEARHFGRRQRLKVKMTRVERPLMFEDEMVSGAFSSMCHQHYFTEKDGVTEMVDQFEFKAPFGLIGRMVESMFLVKHMELFLLKRNRELKEMAESDEWREYLGTSENTL